MVTMAAAAFMRGVSDGGWGRFEAVSADMPVRIARVHEGAD